MASTAANQVIGNASIAVTRPSAQSTGGYAGASLADMGGIVAGTLKVTAASTTYSPDIEQEQSPAKTIYTAKSYKIEVELSEPTLANIQVGWDVINAITGSATKVLSFGTQAVGDLIPTPMVIAVTMFTPGATTATSARTITFNRATLDTPGAMVISKKQISTLPCTFQGLFDNASSKVGVISEITT